MNEFLRGQVLDVNIVLDSCKIFHVDVGSIGDVPFDDIFEMPDELRDVPAIAFAVEMVSCFLKHTRL